MKVIKRIWNTVSTILVVAVLILAVLIAGVRALGITPFKVLTGSMEPDYPVGSMIYIKNNVDAKGLEIGDTITFNFNNSYATHRIVDIRESSSLPGTLEFQTKGDANKLTDGEWVKESDVVGKVLFSIPGFGFFANYIQTPPGCYVSIAMGGVLVIFVFLPDIIFPKKKKETNEEK
ncbi:MAG: signal peptidase I [Clostridia bacterium]|nr:signal peptidase I [Clostridia bacterium]